MREAIEQARRDGELKEVAEVADWPGFRRRLAARIASWTRAECPVEAPPPGGDSASRAQWAIFCRYRAILERLKAEDADGFAARASRVLRLDPPASLKRFRQVTLLEPSLETRANWRALEHMHAVADSVRVALAYDPDPALAEVYAEAASLRGQLLDWGFVESPGETDERRPKGLRDIEHELFRADVHRRPPLSDSEGLTILGASQGEGLGLVLAREVRREIEAGTDPEEMLILVRRWDGDAEVILETLRSWGLPVSAEPARPLASEPAVTALRLAMRLPVEGWEVGPLTQLLRNGQVRPPWSQALGPLALATAASVLQTTRVFRGLDPLRKALDRMLSDTASESGPSSSRPFQEGAGGSSSPEPLAQASRPGTSAGCGVIRPSTAPRPPHLNPRLRGGREEEGQRPRQFGSSARAEERKADRVRLAREVLDRCASTMKRVDRSRPWRAQVDHLVRLSESLGIGVPGDRSLEVLRDALDDQGEVLERLGRGRRWSWSEFVREVESLVEDLVLPAPGAAPGAVRLATVDALAGARATWIGVANLGEGTFPAREAIDRSLALEPPADEATGGAETSNPAFAREMLRFLRVVGSADRRLALAYPTCDPQGQELLRAGFLDDLLGLFAPGALAGVHESHGRFDPTLIDRPDLAGAPSDARIRAVALAASSRGLDALTDLVRRPDHRPALDGTAAALRVAHARLKSPRFGPYDGQLGDPRAIRRLLESFGPDSTFSPSQLESYLFCPFQFFLRYVLKIAPRDERDELEEDFTERGSRIHRVLEQLERALAESPASRREQAERAILEEMGRERSRESDVDRGLREIERRRLARSVRRYLRQHDAYEALSPGAQPIPHLFEVVFGLEHDDPGSYRGLVLGEGPESVRLQGKIDRIDLLADPSRPSFRVIDYKSGSCPSKSDVRQALYLQLPLYALAVERIILGCGETALQDVGYWSLATEGFKPIELKDWDRDRTALETFILRVVSRLRDGDFVVDPRKADCTHRCEYGAVCRLAQARSAGKARDDLPGLELVI